jgi:large subunit ribosomal protein L35
MPKQKTHSGAKKRFRKSATGHYKCAHSGHDHILTKKDRKRKRNLRACQYIDSTKESELKRLLPYQ